MGTSVSPWFQVMNALAMEFEDDTFDLVWACESGEHMPDKKKYVEEMVRAGPGRHHECVICCHSTHAKRVLNAMAGRREQLIN